MWVFTSPNRMLIVSVRVKRSSTSMSKDPSSITGGSFSKCLVEACVDNGNRVEGEDLGLSAGD